MKKKFYDIINIAWKLACKYDFHNLSDDEWQQIVDDGDTAVKKYENDTEPIRKLAHAVFMDVINFYEDLAREESKAKQSGGEANG